MNYEEFREVFLEALKYEGIGEDRLVIKQVHKNNLELEAMTVKKDSSLSISPMLYIQDAFDVYSAGEPIYVIARDFKDILDMEPPDIPFPAMEKSKIEMQLIGYERNEAILKESPHIKIGDMAAIYYLNYDGYTIRLTNELLEKSFPNISESELLEIARENMKKNNPATLQPLNDVLNGDFRNDFEETLNRIKPENGTVILSNKSGMLGAAAMFQDGVLERIAEKLGNDLYILPSSIHEVLIMPKIDGEAPNIGTLVAMVTEINMVNVEPKDVLTNSVYQYNNEAKSLTAYKANDSRAERVQLDTLMSGMAEGVKQPSAPEPKRSKPVLGL